MRIKPKTDQIPVVFHNLRGYDAHHLMQAMSQLQKEVKCVANNMEKYITFSVGGLRFLDALNFLQGSLDSLVTATPTESLKITSTISKGSDLLYIRMNSEFTKNAKSDFENNFYKLINNLVFGKTMETLRNRVDITIVRSNETEKIRKLVASPLYSRHAMFSNDLVGIDMRKSRLLLNKPVYTGMTILDNSKILVYDFFYNELKNNTAQGASSGTQIRTAFCLKSTQDDVYKNIKSNENLYDKRDYPKEHPLHSNANKKFLGKMKDECAGTSIAEYVCLRPKIYS